MFPVSVSPDMAMYNLLKNQGYETSYALAEFIDNAIHAWQQVKGKKAPLSVTIKFYSLQYKNSKKRNSIEIVDTGPGIARDQIEAAFKPARLPASKGLSEFGIGMKTAAVWFADEWALVSCPINDPKKYRFQFNLEELLQSGSDTVNVDEKANDDKIYGTTIFLRNLRRPINSDKHEEICADIRELYQKFTSGKAKTLTLSAEHDDTTIDLQYPTANRPVLDAPAYKTIKGTLYAIEPKRKWTEKVSFKFMGCEVTGYIQLLETGSYTSNPGLVLFRHNRVIMGTTRVPYIPVKLFDTANKYGPQRVYGELHLDDVPVSYTKDKFEFDEDRFLETIKSIPSIVELLRQGSDYRVRATPVSIASEKDATKSSAQGEAAAGKKKSGSSTSSNGNGRKSATAGGGAKGNKGEEAVTFANLLSSLSTTHLSLQNVIEETIHQYETDRPIAAALCFRIVLETGILRKIERDFASEYPKVSERSIHSLLNYIHSNSTIFFDKATYRVKKCVESLTTGTQLNVIFINNIAHGNYHPSIDEIDQFCANSQPLLEWAYS